MFIPRGSIYIYRDNASILFIIQSTTQIFISFSKVLSASSLEALSLTITRSTMNILWALSFSLMALASPVQPEYSSCNDFPTSMLEFSSGFEQPEPPIVKTEFKTSFIQHKWYPTQCRCYHGLSPADITKEHQPVPYHFGLSLLLPLAESRPRRRSL